MDGRWITTMKPAWYEGCYAVCVTVGWATSVMTRICFARQRRTLESTTSNA